LYSIFFPRSTFFIFRAKPLKKRRFFLFIRFFEKGKEKKQKKKKSVQ